MLHWQSDNPVARFVGTGEPTTTRMLNVPFCGNVHLSLTLYAFAKLQRAGADHHFSLPVAADISSAAYQVRAPLKIQSSPKCKALKKFRSAAYRLYVSKKFIPQRNSWDEIWIFRGARKYNSIFPEPP
jgi:hypothetical protein